MELKEIILPVIGFCVGAFGTLVGAGGGIFIVPLLLVAYSFESKVAVGTSLAAVFLNAVSGTIAYIVQKRVDFRIGIPFAIATIPGAIAGIHLGTLIPTRTFSFLFGILLLTVAAYLAFVRDPRSIKGQSVDAVCEYKVSVWWGILISLGVGLLASLFGIGGGVIHVPCMILLLGIPVHVSTATSHFVLAITSAVASSTAFVEGNVNIKFALLLGCGVIFGAQAGARISKVMKGSTIRRLLGVALAILAARLIINYLW